jgi:hypothetical protein
MAAPGRRSPVSDYSEQGAIPAEDASVEDPPTESEVAERQAREFPEQAATAEHGTPGATGGDAGTDAPG